MTDFDYKVRLCSSEDFYNIFHNPYVYDVFLQQGKYFNVYLHKFDQGRFQPIIDELFDNYEKLIPFFQFGGVLFIKDEGNEELIASFNSLKDFPQVDRFEYTKEQAELLDINKYLNI